MDDRSPLFAQLDPAERKLLQMSVHINPVIVATADGKYSLQESAAIADVVRKLMSEDEYRPLILVAGHEEISDAALRVMLETHSKNIGEYLAEVARLLEQLPPDVVNAYRRFALFAIIHVAEAARDGLFGLVGTRISEAEKAVMRKMAEVLRLEPDEEQRAKIGM
ncbi:MAG: hypothetical protein MUF54_12610 [Polyangiaceae bacterium]|nr:hypothetical protein [Polyangiaceae bacterium]